MKDVLYLVSYCLLGRNCRYDGGNAEDGSVIKFLRGKRYIPLCPEELGGLSTPRIPCEIKDGRVINMNGCDITEEFQLGAKKAFEKVKRFIEDNEKESTAPQLNTNDISVKRKICAIMKSKSPSCGKGTMYDGGFTGRLICGNGVFTEYLQRNVTKLGPNCQLEVLTEDELKQRLSEDGVKI